MDTRRCRRTKDLVHPGRVLLEQWMEPFGLTQNGLARHIGVPPRRINEIILGKRAITADTAIRLGEAFANKPRYWMMLQVDYDLEMAERKPGADYAVRGLFGGCPLDW